jgi:hypothetical protein
MDGVLGDDTKTDKTRVPIVHAMSANKIVVQISHVRCESKHPVSNSSVRVLVART